MTEFNFNDGGRSRAGFKGITGDCVTRAIAIATGKEYKEVYDSLMARLPKGKSPRDGIKRRVYERYLKEIGWFWTPTMKIGSGCRVHLKADELPDGKIICRCSRHLVAVIDGVINDIHDPSRDGNRCVYGYFQKGGE